MKRFLQICLLVLCAGGAAVAATPSTQVTVSRPTTKTAVTRPTTAVQVSRPTTNAPISRPQTQVNISRPETRVTVSHPTTAVSVSRPGTTQAGQPTAAAGEKLSSGAKSGKTVASSASATTSMSGYQPPKAKDFQTAQLGGGDSGLGNKVNEAEKDAAAKNSLAPKALSAATAENVMSSANKNVDKGTLSDFVKRETSKHK